MTLTDAGPIIALVLRNDPNHELCGAAARRLPPGPLVTTQACLTESMHFVAKDEGYRGIQRLWTTWKAGKLLVYQSDDSDLQRAMELMDIYKDIPMDLADASLVTVAERYDHRLIFTIDSHFNAYRINGKHKFQIVP